MRLYFSFNSKDQIEDFIQYNRKFNLLLSYEYERAFRPEVVDLNDKWFILDSGAFTVWKSGGVVNIRDYMDCIRRFREQFGKKLIAINLDVIPGKYGIRPTGKEITSSCNKSYENYQILKNEFPELKVMPVFHQYDSWEWLERYLDDDSYLLGISPANDRSTRGRIPWLNQVFLTVKLKKRCHGLAVTGQELLMKYPWYSADSATWVFGAGLGQSVVFRNGRMERFHYKNKEKIIRENAIDVVDTMIPRYRLRRFRSIQAYLDLGNYITELWKARGVTWND